MSRPCAGTDDARRELLELARCSRAIARCSPIARSPPGIRGMTTSPVSRTLSSSTYMTVSPRVCVRSDARQPHVHAAEVERHLVVEHRVRLAVARFRQERRDGRRKAPRSARSSARLARRSPLADRASGSSSRWPETPSRPSRARDGSASRSGRTRCCRDSLRASSSTIAPLSGPIPVSTISVARSPTTMPTFGTNPTLSSRIT